MKVTVSLPDALFKRAEAAAADRKMSRSALYSEAIERYTSKLEADEITARLNEVYADQDSSLDEGVKTLIEHSSRLYDKW